MDRKYYHHGEIYISQSQICSQHMAFYLRPLHPQYRANITNMLQWSKQVQGLWWYRPLIFWLNKLLIFQLMGTFQSCVYSSWIDLKLKSFTCVCMMVILKGILYEFEFGISIYSNFESRVFQSISAKLFDWGLLRSPQFDASD